MFFLLVVGSMVAYQTLSRKTKATTLEDGVVEPAEYSQVVGYVITAVYSVLVIIFGGMYKILARKLTVAENHRY